MLKPKKCRQCGETFTPERTFQPICSPECAIRYAAAKMTAKCKKKVSQDKKAFKNSDKPYLKKIAQQVFNRYIRTRDKDLPCISCGHTGNRQRHSSHFRPVGRNGKLRFNEDNAHSSCSICNTHLSGNLVPYREELIRRIGIERVEKLEGDNEPHTYTVDELKEIINIYKQKAKDLRDN